MSKSEKQPKYKPQQGIVYGVPSGDTLTIVPVGSTLKDEITLYISSIQAPKINHAYPQSKGVAEEPFAWASREYLRKKCIGRRVTYTVQNVIEGTNRVHATVKLGEENLAESIVGEGWATVRMSQGGNSSKLRPEQEALLDLQERATSLKIGIFSNSGKKDSIRPDSSKMTGIRFFDSLPPSKAATGVIERIHSGNSLKIEFPEFRHFTPIVSLAGIVAPGVKWDVSKNALVETEAGGMRAYEFLYSHVLNREVTITFLGCDKFDALFARATVLGRDLATELVKMGLAKVADWTLSQVSDAEYRAALVAAQEQAVKSHAGMWKDANGPSAISNLKKAAVSTSVDTDNDNVEGTVVDIPNAGTIVVEDDKSKKQVRMMLASVRVPKQFRDKRDPTRKEQIDNMFAFEGRLALKALVFARKVVCKRRYDRAPPAGQAGKTQDSSFWDVYYKGANIANELIQKGLAEVVLHKAGEPRSNEYSAFCMAEKRAQGAKLGVFADESKVVVKRVNDLTVDQSRMHSEGFLPFLRTVRGELKCSVEYVFSATRVKLYIPAQNCMISACIAGVTAPKQGQKYADEGLDFMRRLVHMRDLKASSFDMVDKGGNFIATLTFNGENLAVTLVKNGFAQVSESGHRSLASSALEAAEKKAQEAKLRIWEAWNPNSEIEAEQDASAKEAKPKDIAEIVVSDPSTYSLFYIQNAKDVEVAEELAERLADAMEEPEYQQLARFTTMPPKSAGEMFLAYFAEDDMWYRAKVIPRNSPVAQAAVGSGAGGAGTTLVQYIDYGTVARVTKGEMKPIPKGFEVTPQIAQRAALAYVLVPKSDDEYFEDFADYFDSVTCNKDVKAVVEYVESGTHFVTLLDTKNNNLNYDMVRSGLARLAKDKRTKVSANDPAVRALAEAENFARVNRKGMWSYGDIDSDPEN